MTTVADDLDARRTSAPTLGAPGAVPLAGDSLVNRVRASLAPLQRADSLEDLVDQVPVAVAELGFDRVLFSRVEESLWVPERMFVRGDSRWAERILEAGRAPYRRLDGTLLETQLVRSMAPLRVTDPGNRPLMHRGLIDTSRTTGYVAAPVTDGRDVTGFLHADCYHQQRVPTDVEMEALWLFAQSLGALLDRQDLRDRLADVRGALEGRPRGARRPRADGAARADHDERCCGAPLRPVPAVRHGHALQDRVTRRESDVLALMCAGASNDQIARRLTISVGTVKSHVKRILRKLGASNRAEAVSSWLRSEYGHLSVGPPGPV